MSSGSNSSGSINSNGSVAARYLSKSFTIKSSATPASNNSSFSDIVTPPITPVKIVDSKTTPASAVEASTDVAIAVAPKPTTNNETVHTVPAPSESNQFNNVF